MSLIEQIKAWIKNFFEPNLENEIENELRSITTMKANLAAKVEKAKTLHEQAEKQIETRKQELEKKRIEIEQKIADEEGKQKRMNKVQRRCGVIISNIETFMAEKLDDDDEEQAA